MLSDKRKLTIGIIGHEGHGKTTLSHAMLLRSLAQKRSVSTNGDMGMTLEGSDLLERMKKLYKETNYDV